MFKKSFLTVLLVAISIFAFSVVAQADQIDGLTNGSAAVVQPATLNLYVNPGGLGDALIYGYFNARNAYDFLRVINTSLTTGIAAKVRFREGHDSNEILDFFICLSAGDQWSAWIIGDGSTTSPGVLYWYDNDTPTYPDPQGNNDATDNFLAGVAFHYSSTGAAAAVSANDTKEGYFEIIGVSAWADVPGALKVVTTPNECGQQLGLLAPGGGFPTALIDVPNTMAGNTYIFNVEDGAGTYAYNATPLAYCRTTVVAAPGLATDDPPRLDNCDDIDQAGADGAATGINEVNYVLAKSVEYFIYDIETSLLGATDIIETFPTKRLTINASVGNVIPIALNGPFNDRACIAADGSIGTSANADGTGACSTTVTARDESTNGRCDYIAVTIFDDEENSPTVTTGFSPGVTSTLVKCDEVNVITVGDTASPLLNTDLLQFNLAAGGFQLGWVSINTSVDGLAANRNNWLDTAGAIGQDAVGGADATALGLPAIAYELQGIMDGYWTHMLPARYTTFITNP
ncbi:MAG: hypothetical protein HZA17_08380 [Nitrospirae bacterium]|nr:hypothetical protein [Nitrospirota bacterium]